MELISKTSFQIVFVGTYRRCYILIVNWIVDISYIPEAQNRCLFHSVLNYHKRQQIQINNLVHEKKTCHCLAYFMDYNRLSNK